MNYNTSIPQYRDSLQAFYLGNANQTLFKAKGNFLYIFISNTDMAYRKPTRNMFYCLLDRIANFEFLSSECIFVHL